MKQKTNCPNCGAPLEIGKVKCSYCNTIYYDLSAIDFDSNEPIFLTIKKDGYLITQKVLPQTASFEYFQDETYAYGKNDYKLTSWITTNKHIETNINFTAIPDKNNHLIIIKRDENND